MTDPWVLIVLVLWLLPYPVRWIAARRLWKRAQQRRAVERVTAQYARYWALHEALKATLGTAPTLTMDVSGCDPETRRLFVQWSYGPSNIEVSEESVS